MRRFKSFFCLVPGLARTALPRMISGILRYPTPRWMNDLEMYCSVKVLYLEVINSLDNRVALMRHSLRIT